MQVRFIFHRHAPHSEDWGYAIVTTSCPKVTDPVVAFQADAWDIGYPSDSQKENEARLWLDQAVGDGLSKSTM
jgi:hypothetical protein